VKNVKLKLLGLIFGLAVVTPVIVPESVLVLIGDHSGGQGKGFSMGRFDTDSGVLTPPKFWLEAAAPAYFVLTADKRLLYTCNSDGFVSAYRVDPMSGKLTYLNRQPTGGGDPSYIVLDKTERYAFVANYQGGSIAGWSVKADGSLGDRTAFVQHTGSSIDPKRQTHAYAHSIVFDPSNRYVLVADLGLDKLFVYKFDPANGSLAPNDPAFAAVAPGSGPRHVVFHPNGRWVYLVTEMGSTVHFYHWDGRRGMLHETQSISTLPGDFHGVSTSAELRVSADGRFLYTSNRGHNSITVFSVDAKNGTLRMIQNLPSEGKTPRNIDFDPTGRWLLVTNQDSNNAVVFRIDRMTGELTQVGSPVAVPSTFCPRFLALQR
jgi:6-phosphogluconolactonase